MATCKVLKTQTNPRYPSFTQTTFTAGDVQQFDAERSRKNVTTRPYVKDDGVTGNFADKTTVLSWDQIQWPKYTNVTSEAVTNTFAYMFHKFKKGIFISVIDGQLDNFLPFSKANYTNEFYKLIRVDPNKYSSVQQLLDKANALSGFKPSKALPLDEWQANNAMFRYEYQRYEGDQNVEILKDMFETLVLSRPNVTNVQAYINKRDYPLLKLDGTEPYNHLYGTLLKPLVSHNYDQYVPILSCCNTLGFADLLIPTYEDWARVQYQTSKKTFPNACKEYPKIQITEWNKKAPVAVFRGSSTGAGTTPETNQRLKALQIAESTKNNGHLDVGITNWNTRPRKHQTSKFLETIERANYPKANMLSLQQQSKGYKYILNLEGHVAAYRLSYELSSGSVVLLANSRWKVWYSKYLVPFEHFVPVDEDLGNLIEMVEWCRNNDQKCQKIAKNAKSFYDQYLSYNSILDYLQQLFLDISFTCGSYDYLPNLQTLFIESEKRWLETVPNSGIEYNYPLLAGPRCVGRLNATRQVFTSKTKEKLQFVRSVFTSKNGKVDCYKTNEFYIVEKSAFNTLKQLEHTHEAYVGLNSINLLVSKCPNYAYVYGRLQNGPEVYVEYIVGTTFTDWLASPAYNFNDYIGILIQLNLALAVGQAYCGFVHNDLYPWNVVLQNVPTPVDFDYIVGTKKALKYTTTLIPVMIDFGKSATVVYEKEFGLVDHGFTNLFQSNKILDTSTLLLSSMKILGDKLDRVQVNTLLEFFSQMGIQTTVFMGSKYGVIGDVLSTKDPLAFGPIDFINFLDVKFGHDTRLSIVPSVPTEKMARGNIILELSTMELGNRDEALLQTVLYINRQTIPTSRDQVTRAFIDNLVQRRLPELDEIMATAKPKTLIKYQKVRNDIVNSPQESIETATIVVDFATQNYVDLDENMSPQTLEYKLTVAVPSLNDWLSISHLCIEGAVFDDRLDVFGIFDVDPFVYYHVIASNNNVGKILQEIQAKVNCKQDKNGDTIVC